jgi:hypothetical protein
MTWRGRSGLWPKRSSREGILWKDLEHQGGEVGLRLGDKPVEVEKIGIEHVPEGVRHGSPNRTFTLWFAANLTIADYVIGVLTTVYFGFTMAQAIPVLLVGNLLGGLFLIPFLWMISVSLQDAQGMFAQPFRWIPDRLRWENYAGALSAVPFGRYLFNTTAITASPTCWCESL